MALWAAAETVLRSLGIRCCPFQNCAFSIPLEALWHVRWVSEVQWPTTANAGSRWIVSR